MSLLVCLRRQLRSPHNPKVEGSNPSPATKSLDGREFAPGLSISGSPTGEGFEPGAPRSGGGEVRRSISPPQELRRGPWRRRAGRPPAGAGGVARSPARGRHPLERKSGITRREVTAAGAVSLRAGTGRDLRRRTVMKNGFGSHPSGCPRGREVGSVRGRRSIAACGGSRM